MDEQMNKIPFPKDKQTYFMSFCINHQHLTRGGQCMSVLKHLTELKDNYYFFLDSN